MLSTPTLVDLSHKDAFTHRCFYTPTNFTHGCYYTHIRARVLHTDAFTHRRFTQKHFYTQSRLHTDAFTLGRFCTGTLLHTGTLRQLDADAFTHRCFYTQTSLHTHTQNRIGIFTSVLDHQPSFRVKKLRGNPQNRSSIKFFHDQPLFRTQRFRGTTKNRKFISILDDRPSFNAKDLGFAIICGHCRQLKGEEN